MPCVRTVVTFSHLTGGQVDSKQHTEKSGDVPSTVGTPYRGKADMQHTVGKAKVSTIQEMQDAALLKFHQSVGSPQPLCSSNTPYALL